MPLRGFDRAAGRLQCENVPLEEIAAQAGTPAYIYSASAILDNFRAYREALPDAEIAYSVKANSSLAILSLLANAGSGFDIVSGGELYRVLRAGGDPARVVFSGVGKTREELDYALDSQVGCFNCESAGELELLREAARQKGASPRVALRVNPDVEAKTHRYIQTGERAHKFGIPMEQAEALYRQDLAPLRLTGASCHIGSQIFDPQKFLDALARLLDLIDRLSQAGARISSVDLGGGLGIAYGRSDESPSIAQYGRMITEAVAGRDIQIILEPGRSIVGQTGVLLTRTLYVKDTGEKSFVIVDAAMNDLIRPALYQSEHEILPVIEQDRPEITADVVGPICESGDFLAQDRQITAVEPGELLAVATAGAYGFVLASNYNSRPRPPEVLVEGDQWRQIRRRESYEDLVRGEQEI